MEASLKKARALRLRFSQSLASRRQRFSQAIVRSTIQRLGNGTNPLARSERLTISVLRLGRTLPSRGVRSNTPETAYPAGTRSFGAVGSSDGQSVANRAAVRWPPAESKWLTSDGLRHQPPWMNTARGASGRVRTDLSFKQACLMREAHCASLAQAEHPSPPLGLGLRSSLFSVDALPDPTVKKRNDQDPRCNDHRNGEERFHRPTP
jgi:hypothetical protein